MADDNVALAVRLEARFDKLERDLKKVGALADDAVKDAEKKFEAFNPGLSAIQGFFQGIGQSLFKALDPAGLVKRLTEVNQQLATIGDTAKRVGVDVEELQAIRFSIASRSGIGTDDFLKAAKEFAGELQKARKDEGDLFELFKANGKTLKDSKGEVISMREAFAIVADLVKNARTELDKFKIAEKAGLAKEMVPALEQGADAFERTARAAEESGQIIRREVVEKAREFRTQWNNALERFNTGVQSAMAELISLIDQLINRTGTFREVWIAVTNIIEQSAVTLKALAQGIDSLNAKQAQLLLDSGQFDEATRRALQQRKALLDEAREIGGPTLEGSQTRLVVRRSRPSFNAGGTKLPKDDDDKDSKDAFDKATEAINKRTAALLADTAAVGLAAGAQEQFRAELRLLEAAQREDTDITDAMINKYAEYRRTMTAVQALQKSGIELTEEQNKKFAEAPARIGAAAAALNQAKDAFAGITDSLRFAGNELVNVLDKATQRGFVFQDVMRDVLRNVTKQLLQAAITGEGAFAKILGLNASAPGGIGGIAGIVSGVLRGFGGVNPANIASPSFGDFIGPRHLQLGGHVAPGEWAIAGEHGPEPVFGGRTGLTVTPHGGPGGSVVFSPTTIVDARGSTLTEGQVAAMIATANRRTLRAVDESFGSRSAKLASLGS